MKYGPKPRPVYTNTVLYDKSFSTDCITLMPDTLYRAPEGKQLTMTINGVETEIKAGTYLGDIRFTITDDLGGILNANLHPNNPAPDYRTALYVDENGIAENKSVLSALAACQYSSSGISGGHIASMGPLFNAVVVNNCSYEISDLDVQLTGRGGDDFNGYGACLIAAGTANLHVKNSKFETWGCIRGVITAGGKSEVLFEHCTMECHGGDLREQEITDGMNEVPWVLGLSGNCRATNLVQGTHTTYRDCEIRAFGWGALSTDAADGCVLEAENCRIEITGPSGYGSYSVGSASNHFRSCTFVVPDYALVLAQASGGRASFSDTMVSSARFGLMWHSHTNPAPCTIEDSTFYTGMTTFLFKGCCAHLSVCRSDLRPGNGVILQMMDSDDPGLFADRYVVCDNSNPEKDPDFDVSLEHADDLFAEFSDMDLDGSFFNARTGKKISAAGVPGAPESEPSFTGINLILCLNGCRVHGVISSATEHHTNVAPGQSITEAENRIELGQVTNEVSPAVNNGVILKLKNTSWVVSGESHLTVLELDAASSITGSITVNGEALDPKPGKYQGQILVRA